MGPPSVPNAVEAARTKYNPSQSAESLLKDFFEFNPQTHLDPAHQTTSFTVDQMIQLARAVWLGVLAGLFRYAGGSTFESEVCLWEGQRCGKVSGGSSFPGRVGTVVSERAASRSVSRWKVGKWLTLGLRNCVWFFKQMKFCRQPLQHVVGVGLTVWRPWGKLKPIWRKNQAIPFVG